MTAGPSPEPRLGHDGAARIIDAVRVRLDADGIPITNFGDLRYTGWGGGVPIVHDGHVVGAVGVSGLPEADDVELARLGSSVPFSPTPGS